MINGKFRFTILNPHITILKPLENRSFFLLLRACCKLKDQPNAKSVQKERINGAEGNAKQ